MAKEDFIRDFPVTVYGNLTKFSDTISKARCRIFYKYENRNGGYITDEFAEKLLSTISYAPVKGIYDGFNDDYTDHGEARNEGRIYGIVPENHNLQWEKHLDEDGIEREYACVDVLLFTALYKEAEEIVGKPQSMEIYPPSIKGDWEVINGRKVFKYTEGSFLGLQVLGDEIEPCFEGAAFFALYDSIEEIKAYLEECFSLKNQKEQKGGQLQMSKLNFKLSDSQKHDILWSLLNSNYNEEGGWVVEYSLCDIYDDYAIAYNYEEGSYLKVDYVKDDETDSVSITGTKKVFAVYVSEEELKTIETLRTLNGSTFEVVSETLEGAQATYEKVQGLEEEISTYEQKIEEANTNLATLQSEKEQFTAQVEELNNTIHSLNEQVNELTSYKENVETEQKKAIIKSYSKLLSDDVLESYTSKISEYSVSDLDKELAYEVKQSNFSAFSQASPMGFVPKDGPIEGIVGILSKYRK